jgi:4-hydroxy 2-oxovalerate aldolase
LAADYSIHPTYIQEMISDNKYSNNEIIQIIESMKDIPSKSYNKDILERLKSKSNEKTKTENSQGTWDANNWCSGKEVLLIGSGPSSLDYKEAIIEYIKNYKPYVLCLNINRDYDENLIDGYVTANGSRVLMESKYYLETNKPIYTSIRLFSDDPNFGHISKYIKDFGVTVKENSIKINNNHCEIPYPLSAIYALCLLSAGKAKKIYMVGFDGYEKNDNKQDNMIDAINQYKSNAKSIELVSLTPTSYPISKSSIYAPK